MSNSQILLFLHISSFICELESGTRKSERPLIAKQGDQFDTLIKLTIMGDCVDCVARTEQAI